MSRMLAETGHTLISAGAFVFDDDDDYLSGDEIDQDRLKLQVNIHFASFFPASEDFCFNLTDLFRIPKYFN